MHKFETWHGNKCRSEEELKTGSHDPIFGSVSIKKSDHLNQYSVVEALRRLLA